MDIKDMDEAYKFLDAETEELVLDPAYEKASQEDRFSHHDHYLRTNGSPDDG